jgi:hypothetical protein
VGSIIKHHLNTPSPLLLSLLLFSLCVSNSLSGAALVALFVFIFIMYVGWLAGSVRSDCRVMMVMMIGCSARRSRLGKYVQRTGFFAEFAPIMSWGGT